MAWRCSILLFFFFLSRALAAQQVPEEELAFSEMHQRYLKSAEDPEKLIGDILDTMQGADLAQSLKYLQIALTLEKKLPAPKPILFELNFRAAELISRIDKAYALAFFEKASHLVPLLEHALNMDRIYYLYTDRAFIHHALSQIDSAVFYLDKAIEYAGRINTTTQASAINNAGFFYAAIGRDDVAKEYFTRAFNLYMQKHDDHFLYHAILDNLAQLDIKQGRYKEAIEAIAANNRVYLEKRNYYQYLSSLLRLLSALELAKAPFSAIDSAVREAHHYITLYPSEFVDKDLLAFFRFANDFYFRHRSYERQALFRDHFMVYNEKVNAARIHEYNQLTKVLLELRQEAHTAELHAMQLSTDKARLKLKNALFATTGILVSCVLVMLLLYQARKYTLAKLRTKEMEARLLRQDLELKKRDLTNVVLHNTQVYDSNQKIIRELETIGQGKQKPEEQIQTLLMELQGQNQVNDRSIELVKNIETVNEEFYESLRTRFPGLTKSELELCGYIRINLSNKDISILKNVASESVKMSRKRLKKKLGLRPEDKLDAFIQAI